ncbi:glycosyltransferase [Aciditerrimonas ferrireducens]|uniref:glycosyltransferase n=1 Tax=Aciditerrimonas ferrireducens TaxID=667306 RepID=UPI0020069CDE|nr:glycosyltransferase [Aciditerrimonas ferrireducens]MCK4176030.1 hypothetical protein [Aciditerrimonas ferrireducens]
MGARAVVLTGSLGLGHDVVSQVLTEGLVSVGYEVRTLDCMALLGSLGGRAGDAVFRRLLAHPALYDGLHFAHLRPGSALAETLDRAATRRLVPALAAALGPEPPELAVACFATGSSALARLVGGPWAGAPRRPATVCLCTDASPHRLWVQPGLDLFLVTSPAAAQAVRRYLPRARVGLVPPPVRAGFLAPPSKTEARRALGVPEGTPTVLLMGGGWGLGPLAEAARSIGQTGVWVLALAGRNPRAARALDQVAAAVPTVRSLGFSDQVPLLMAASDLVVTTPGATTCSEARAVGRPLLLLDVVPGHGRDNIQHELGLGQAGVVDPEPGRLAEAVLAALADPPPPSPCPPAGTRRPGDFAEALTEALAGLGGPGPVQPGPARAAADPPGLALVAEVGEAGSHQGRRPLAEVPEGPPAPLPGRSPSGERPASQPEGGPERPC